MYVCMVTTSNHTFVINNVQHTVDNIFIMEISRNTLEILLKYKISRNTLEILFKYTLSYMCVNSETQSYNDDILAF